MNAQEARELATQISTQQQQQDVVAATNQIRDAAGLGERITYLSPRRIHWLKTYLQGEGYKVEDISNQYDGPTLKVSW